MEVHDETFGSVRVTGRIPSLKRIRDAGREDLPAILEINREGAPGVGRLDLSEATGLLERSTFLRVAEDGSGVTGYVIVFASGTPYDGEEYLWFGRRPGDFLYVDQVAVARIARGRGVASALYADVERAARERGLLTIACEVNLRPENLASLRFHARQGFLEVGTLETRDGRLVSLLEKRLQDG